MRSAASILVMLLVVHSFARGDDAATAFEQRVLPVLKAHCTTCHGGEKPEAGFDLTAAPSLDQLQTQGDHWFNVLERVEAGSMPPEDSDPIEPAGKRTLIAWIRGDLTQLLNEQQRKVGRSRFRRLSRNEYANVVQDIFGIRPPVVRLMPGDGRVDGYDKVSAALPFSPASTEGHLQIAEEIVNRMFQHPQTPEQFRLWSRGSEQSKGHLLELEDNWNVSFNSDANSGALRKANADGSPGGGFPGPRKPGRHRLRMNVYGFALESFDVMGGFRTNYRTVSTDDKGLKPGQEKNAAKWRDGLPVDCSGITPDGKPFANVRELRQMLAQNPYQLARGVTRHLITYATGEPATPIDQPAIEAIVKDAARDDYGLRSIVHAVIQSELFRFK